MRSNEKRRRASICVQAKTKSLIAKRADDTGRTISRQVEHMIEQLIQFERVFGTVKGAVDQLLLRHGYTRLGISNPRTGQRGFAWQATQIAVLWRKKRLFLRQIMA